MDLKASELSIVDAPFVFICWTHVASRATLTGTTTPRSPDMFGSLAVVFPAPHTGGALVFRHGDLEYAFDSAEAVSQSTPSRVCYILQSRLS